MRRKVRNFICIAVEEVLNVMVYCMQFAFSAELLFLVICLFQFRDFSERFFASIHRGKLRFKFRFAPRFKARNVSDDAMPSLF